MTYICNLINKHMRKLIREYEIHWFEPLMIALIILGIFGRMVYDSSCSEPQESQQVESVLVQGHWIIDRPLTKEDLKVDQDYYFSFYWDSKNTFTKKAIRKYHILGVDDNYILYIQPKYLGDLPEGYLDLPKRHEVDFTHTKDIKGYLKYFRLIGSPPVEEEVIEVESVVETEYY